MARPGSIGSWSTALAIGLACMSCRLTTPGGTVRHDHPGRRAERDETLPTERIIEQTRLRIRGGQQRCL